MTDVAELTFEQICELAARLDSDDRLRLIEYLGNTPSTLTAQEILDKLNEHAAALREMGVLRVGLFGSYARGEARTNSDIDLLVNLKEDLSLYKGYMPIKHYLEDLFSREVDLVEEQTLKEHLRPAVMEEVIYAEEL